jgi:hypothetical protein
MKQNTQLTALSFSNGLDKDFVDPSVNRQTHLVAALILVAAIALSLLVNRDWIYLALLPAFGLTLDALTGFCPMRQMLSKCPWNNPQAH